MLKGIDVSTFQGKIDWSKVKANGIDFAMIKATQGRGESRATRNLRTFTDSQFSANINCAAAAGIECGVYHYFTAVTDKEAREEAEYFIKAISPYRSRINLWAAVDVESEIYLRGLKPEQLTSVVKTFIKQVEAAGYKPMLYTNPNYLKYRFLYGAFGDTDIWLAHWNVDSPMKVANTKIWQTGTGRVNGIKSDVDMNIGYFDIDCGITYKAGDKYVLKAGDRYSNGISVPAKLFGRECTISQVKSNRILLDEIFSWVLI